MIDFNEAACNSASSRCGRHCASLAPQIAFGYALRLGRAILPERPPRRPAIGCTLCRFFGYFGDCVEIRSGAKAALPASATCGGASNSAAFPRYERTVALRIWEASLDPEPTCSPRSQVERNGNGALRAIPLADASRPTGLVPTSDKEGYYP